MSGACTFAPLRSIVVAGRELLILFAFESARAGAQTRADERGGRSGVGLMGARRWANGRTGGRVDGAGARVWGRAWEKWPCLPARV